MVTEVRRSFETKSSALTWAKKLKQLWRGKKNFKVVRSTKADTFFPNLPRGKWAVREKKK